jgi:hypothetical protein
MTRPRFLKRTRERKGRPRVPNTPEGFPSMSLRVLKYGGRRI